MSIQLTAEQLKAAIDSPLRIKDPATSQEYVLVRAEVYKQLAHRV